MGTFSSWTHCFLTHVTLDKLSGFKYHLGTNSYGCSNCRCPQFPWQGGFRAVCLENCEDPTPLSSDLCKCQGEACFLSMYPFIARLKFLQSEDTYLSSGILCNQQNGKN